MWKTIKWIFRMIQAQIIYLLNKREFDGLNDILTQARHKNDEEKK